MTSWSVFLFDLDGTLSDSAPGILASLRTTFAELGLPPLDAEVERSLLGPPFRDSLPPLIGDLHVEDVVDRYRSHYGRGGMFDTTVYEGIPDLLQGLTGWGARLALATSKAEQFAPDILRHLGLLEYFDVVCGDDPAGGRGSKAAVVGEALTRLGRPHPADVVMVGDRFHDVRGAAVHGVSTLGAGWGYGAPGELAEAGALAVYETPAALSLSVSRSVSAGRPPTTRPVPGSG